MVTAREIADQSFGQGGPDILDDGIVLISRMAGRT